MTTVRRSERSRRLLLGELSPARIFLLFAPLLYAAYALLTPPFQTPDEHQHLFRAWQLSELQLFGERRGDRAGGVLPDGVGQAARRELGIIEPHARRVPVQRPLATLFNPGTPPETGAPPRFFNFFGSVIYSPAGYMPQIAAIWIGRSAGLSVEGIILLGRLLNAALTILLIYYAVRLTPVGALGLMCVGLLPMSASASAAFGQDGLAIGGACLLIAIGLRVALRGRWERSDLLISAALACLLTFSKILYLPLAMVSGQPFSPKGVQWRRMLVPLLICMITAVLTALWLRANSGVVVPPQVDIPPAGDRLAEWLRHPTEFLTLLERTYVTNGVQLFDTLFTFGWLNVGPVRSAAFLSMTAFVLTLVAGDPAADQLDWQTRLWLLLIAASVVLLISVALYLYWTPASDTLIAGLQARYFVPVVPLVLTALLPKRDSDLPYGAMVALLMIAANVLALGAIVDAYYHW